MPGDSQFQVPAQESHESPIQNGPSGVKISVHQSHGGTRKKIVVVGLGMVGISFM